MVRFLVTTFFATLWAVWITACFSPKESDGTVPCGSAGECPPGFTCGGDNLCYRNAPPADAAVSIDAGAEDASVTDATADAPIGPDASVADAAPIADAGDVDALIVACNDGIDNDCDGLVDWPDDPGCSGPLDPTEKGPAKCDNGKDDDGDGTIDFQLTTACQDTVYGGHPTDPKCTGPADNNEMN